MWFGPGLVSMSPAKRIRCPGLTPASASLGGNSCHPPAGERGQLAEKTAVLGPPCGGQGCWCSDLGPRGPHPNRVQAGAVWSNMETPYEAHATRIAAAERIY